MLPKRLPFLRVLIATLALSGVMAEAADARVFIGLGVPLFVPGPVFVPPPAYYGPPPGYYGPPAYGPPGYGPPAGFSYAPPQGPQSLSAAGGAQVCVAGPYTCPLLAATPPGGGCHCPGHDGRRIPGQAN
jgi:hypothetical protein